jgi:hypothetical protein
MLRGMRVDISTAVNLRRKEVPSKTNADRFGDQN